MKNTIETQLTDLGFFRDGIEYRLEFATHKGAANSRLNAVFSCDDGQWTGYIKSAYGFESFSEDWDGEQPIEKWLERMEKAYWDV